MVSDSTKRDYFVFDVIMFYEHMNIRLNFESSGTWIAEYMSAGKGYSLQSETFSSQF
jgi:hypothetical protein